MNTNFLWQPNCIPMIPDHPNTLFFNAICSNFSNQSYLESSFQQLKNKYALLELENLRLKQQISVFQSFHNKKRKRIIKRRKEEELQKSYKCSHSHCKKQYASTLALNLHIKNKHPEDIKVKEDDKNTEPFPDQSMIKQQGQNSTTQ